MAGEAADLCLVDRRGVRNQVHMSRFHLLCFAVALVAGDTPQAPWRDIVSSNAI